jgi:hypothetical protein
VTGSNRRPSRCKRDALPAELTARDRSLMQGQRVAHWVSRVNAVAGYPVEVPVQTITRAGCRGPGRRAPFRHRSSSRTAPRRAAPPKRKRQTGRPERSRPACRWTPPSRSFFAPKRRLRWRTARPRKPLICAHVQPLQHHPWPGGHPAPLLGHDLTGTFLPCLPSTRTRWRRLFALLAMASAS